MNDPTPTIPDMDLPLFTRRRVIAGAALLGAGLVAAACGSDSNSSGPGGSSPATPGGSEPMMGSTPPSAAPASGDGSVDLEIAALAAGLEVLAVGTYKAALDAAGAGSLGDVPPAVAEFVTVSMGHHQAHLDAWNGVLAAAGVDEVTEPNAALKPMVDAEFAKVTDVPGAATLALLLEQTAAATYLNAQNVLTDKDAIMLAGSIQIVDAQHASILLYVLGEYPVPEVFAGVDMAAAA